MQSVEKNVTDNGLFRKILTDHFYEQHAMKLQLKYPNPLKKENLFLNQFRKVQAEEKRTNHL